MIWGVGDIQTYFLKLVDKGKHTQISLYVKKYKTKKHQNAGLTVGKRDDVQDLSLNASTDTGAPWRAQHTKMLLRLSLPSCVCRVDKLMGRCEALMALK